MLQSWLVWKSYSSWILTLLVSFKNRKKMWCSFHIFIRKSESFQCTDQKWSCTCSEHLISCEEACSLWGDEIQIPSTGYVGVVSHSTSVATASWSAFDGTLQLLWLDLLCIKPVRENLGVYIFIHQFTRPQLMKWTIQGLDYSLNPFCAVCCSVIRKPISTFHI